uniref:VP2 n=1 Tax=Morris orbivirus TaxID=1963252 RepID=A0A1S6PCZ7_9REOV|nr:VP2 [Morris orbivirus]
MLNQVLGIAFMLVYVRCQNVGYDCTSDQSNYTTISLIDIGDCHFEDDDITEEVTEIQLLQTRETRYVNVYSCLINLHYTINYCGMHSHNSLVKGGIVVETYSVSNEECLTMHKLRRARIYGQEFQIESFNTTYTRWITLAGGIDHDGTCSRGIFNNKHGSYKDVVVHGQMSMLFSTGVAIRSVKGGDIKLASGIVCDSETISCIDPTYGYVFWNVKDLYPCAEDAYHVVYQGPATKVSTLLGKGRNGVARYSTMFSVKEDDQLFTLSTVGDKEICRYHMYQTEHPRYLIYETRNSVYPFKREPIPTNDLDLFMYVNAKIMYITKGIERSMRNMYRALSTEICELERQQLKTLMTIGYSNPSHFAYQYMNSPGFTAISAGEAIHVIKCTPVPISPRSSEDCTLEYPVYYANISYFMSPRTHVLQKTGTPTPCADVLTPEYKIANKWYSFRKGMFPTHNPIVISPKSPPRWEGLDLGNIISAGIYTPEQIERVRHQIMYPQERRAINEIFTGSLNGDSISHNSLNYGILIDKNQLKSQFHEWWLETWGIFKFVGELGSIAFSFYIIITLSRAALSALFKLKALHEIFGCSVVLFTSIIDGLADYILHKNSHKFSAPKKEQSQDIELQDVEAMQPLDTIATAPPECKFIDLPCQYTKKFSTFDFSLSPLYDKGLSLDPPPQVLNFFVY